ncbi:hypothetical protein ES708_16240 [subsurface metagenome]
MPSRGQRDRTWTHGQRDSTLRNHRLQRKRASRLGDPTREELLECLKDGFCWWCQTGPWKMLAGHTSKAHGITAVEIRHLAFLFKHTSICSKECSTACSKRVQNINLSPNFVSVKGHKKVFSEAGRISEIKRLLAGSSNEQRLRASKINALKHSKPHPCPVCGRKVPTSFPITCSPECRKVIRQRTALISAATRKRLSAENPEYGAESRRRASDRMKRLFAEGKGPMPNPPKPHPCPVCGTIVPKAHPTACSTKCRRVLLQRAQAKATQHRAVKVPREDYAKVAERYWAGESATLIATEYSVTPRFIRAIAKEQKVSV